MHKNLRLALLDQLMQQGVMPRFDIDAFFRAERGVPFDHTHEYDLQPFADVAEYLSQVELQDTHLAQLTELYVEPGSQLQRDVFPQWSGEDNYFDVPTLDGLDRCVNLKTLWLQLLPPETPTDISAIARLSGLTTLTFDGGVLTSLDALRGPQHLKSIEFNFTGIEDNQANRDIVQRLRQCGCDVVLRSTRWMSG